MAKEVLPADKGEIEVCLTREELTLLVQVLAISVTADDLRIPSTAAYTLHDDLKDIARSHKWLA